MPQSFGTNTYNRANWEESAMPVLCETCLGDNPYVRMIRDRFGRACKICKRPYTGFRWCPGAKMRYKNTEICQACSRLKNACQTCILDLEYGLPIQVRDEVLKIHESNPKDPVNKDYYLQNVDMEISKIASGRQIGGLGDISVKNDQLVQMARREPYYNRNRAHVCSFWVKGECKRGHECPYRHEKPTDPDDVLHDQNIKDRYYGNADPVAAKLLNKNSSLLAMDPPADKSITTVYVGGLEMGTTEAELRDYFYQFGEIRSIKIVESISCAFVQYSTREAAELAVMRAHNNTVIRGKKLNVRWGKAEAERGAGIPNLMDNPDFHEPVPGLAKVLPPVPKDLESVLFEEDVEHESSDIPPIYKAVHSRNDFIGVPPPPPPSKRQKVYYASQDPTRMGSK